MRLIHAEIDAAVLDIHVELLEGAFVEQEVEALARRELAALVLGLDTGGAAPCPRPVAADFKLFQDFLHSRSPCDGPKTVNSMGLRVTQMASHPGLALLIPGRKTPAEPP